MIGQQVHAVMGGRKLDFTSQDVYRIMQGVEPERIRRYFVEVDGVRFPPKQVIAALTGWERQSFNTQEAQRVLAQAGLRLGPDAESVNRLQGVPVVNDSYARVVRDSLLVGRTVYDKTGEPVAHRGVGVQLGSVEIWELIGELEKLAERLERRGE